MKIVIIGTGYVGLVTGACLAEQNYDVICVDQDQHKVNRLKQGIVPFFEPGLEALVKQGIAAGSLQFTPLAGVAVQGADAVFIAVGTPPGQNGAPDLRALHACVATLTEQLSGAILLVIKSTVPPGTCRRIQEIFDNSPRCKKGMARVTVASNPEFLAEGRAVQDFREPERIVVGAEDARARATLKTLYQPFDPSGRRLLCMDVASAELAKYACNAMLAARISMVNEIARIAGGTGSDMASVCAVMGSDPRIGRHYLEAGVGYGGSCLPKDLQSLMHVAREQGTQTPMLAGIAQSNLAQRELLVQTIVACLGGDLRNQRIAVWGLAFKPDTDDIREAPSLALIPQLLAGGARISAYDPVAMPGAAARLNHPRLHFAVSAEDACEDADVLVVMTQWPEFLAVDLGTVAAAMQGKIVIDGRQMFQAHVLQAHGLQRVLPWKKMAICAQEATTAQAVGVASAG